MSVSRLILMLGVLLGGCSHALLGQYSPSSDLAGIGPLSVLVEELSDDARSLGLTSNDLQTKVELELRKAGIPVATRRDAPHVFVYVRVVRGTESISYYVNIFVVEWAVPIRRMPEWSKGTPGVATPVPVWDAGGRTGFVGIGKAQDTIMVSVTELVEKFMNDYLTANPR